MFEPEVSDCIRRVLLIQIVLCPLLVIAACSPDEQHNQQNGTKTDENKQEVPPMEQWDDSVLADRFENREQEFRIVHPDVNRSGDKKIFRFRTARVRIEDKGEYFQIAAVYWKDQKIHTVQGHRFRSLYTIEHRDTGYLFIEMWTGGAHCCFPVSAYSVSPSSVTHLKTFELGSAYIDPERDLFTQSDNLYYRMHDGRFAHFHVSFASSILLDRYFRITPRGITEVNERFRNAYLTEAQRHRKKLLEILRMPEQRARSVSVDTAKEEWFPHLLGYTVNQVMAGQKKQAWQRFNRAFEQIRTTHPYWMSGINRDELKKDIQRKLSEQN